MKRMLSVMFALLAALTTLLLVAQEQDGEVSTEVDSPVNSVNPADDEMWQWMIGEWEGRSESAMGKSEDWMKFEWDLHDQFLVTEVRSVAAELNPEVIASMAKEQGTSEDAVRQMMSAPYSAKGFSTIDPQSGEITGYWFDSYRGIFKGSEIREDDRITMRMQQINGNVVIERSAEKVGVDKMVGTFKSTLPDGEVIEGTFEAVRKR